jgi:cholesterol transport system auxiliary component
MLRRIAITLAAASLASCVSLLPEQKVPEGLYRFGPTETVHPIDASIIIREPEASRLFGGRAIASEDSSGALRLVPGVEWTDSATRMMQIALLESLGGEGGGVAIGSDTGADADFELAWRMSDFTLSGAIVPTSASRSAPSDWRRSAGIGTVSKASSSKSRGAEVIRQSATSRPSREVPVIKPAT